MILKHRSHGEVLEPGWLREKVVKELQGAGGRHPEGPARILLQVIDREPEAVMRALYVGVQGVFDSQVGLQVAEGDVSYRGKRQRVPKGCSGE